MPVVVFAGRKGGCGKTTGAVNLAAWLAAKYPGEVALLDSDPVKGSHDFVRLREASGYELPKIHCEYVSGEIKHAITALASDYTWVIVDTPGLDSIESKRAMALATVVVMPAKNSLLDQKTLPVADELMQEFQIVRPDLKAMVLLSECPPGVSGRNRRGTSQARLSGLKALRLLESFTTARNAYATCYELGIGVVESDDKKAAAEFELVAQEIHDHAI